jgi:hypothetical protein
MKSKRIDLGSAESGALSAAPSDHVAEAGGHALGGVTPARHRIEARGLIATEPSAKKAALAAPRESWGGNVQDSDGPKRTRRTQV